jgi:hypothetical protein
MIPIGSGVYLKSCPTGEPGTVTGEQRGRVLVHWADLNLSGKHRPETLQVISVPPAGKDEHP